MKVAIIGSRSFDDYELVLETLKQYTDITEIVSGGAKGADALAERYANEYAIPIKLFLPDWKKFGRAAGVVRNKDIIAYCDMAIAFWDGASKGTKSSINICGKTGTRVEVVQYLPDDN